MVWLVALGAAALHFGIGGAWYSPALFGRAWMRGLGLTAEDIAEGKVDLAAALATSALASLVQVGALLAAVLLFGLGEAWQGAALGAGAALAFGLMPMLRDRAWGDRPWAVVLVDAGHEVAAGAAAGAVLAWAAP